MEPFVLDEIARITADDVISEHENSVKSEIMTWARQKNIDIRALEGVTYVSVSDENGLMDNVLHDLLLEELSKEFWYERLNSYGKIRAVR